MDIDLEQHQVDLAETARRFFEARSAISAVRAWEDSEAGFAPGLWAEMAGLGWLRLGHPESAGGVGGGVLELSVIYQAMGRTLAPVPHLESAVIGAGVLAAADTPATRDLLLRLLAESPDTRIIAATHSGPIRAFATWAHGYDPGEPYNTEEVVVRIRRGGGTALVAYRNRVTEVNVPPPDEMPVWE